MPSPTTVRGPAWVPPGRCPCRAWRPASKPWGWMSTGTPIAPAWGWWASRCSCSSRVSISGYRSHDYQLGIFERKLGRGQSIDEILAVNAAPGFSEHHSGRALDIGTPGEPPAEDTFEGTGAFAWLRDNAAADGFVLSYPRDNPHGIAYEPWHWRFSPASA